MGLWAGCVCFLALDFAIGFLKRPKAVARKEDLGKILTKKYFFAIDCTTLILSFTCAFETWR